MEILALIKQQNRHYGFQLYFNLNFCRNFFTGMQFDAMHMKVKI